MKFGLATTFLALAAAPSLVQGENLYCDESAEVTCILNDERPAFTQYKGWDCAKFGRSVKIDPTNGHHDYQGGYVKNNGFPVIDAKYKFKACNENVITTHKIKIDNKKTSAKIDGENVEEFNKGGNIAAGKCRKTTVSAYLDTEHRNHDASLTLRGYLRTPAGGVLNGGQGKQKVVCSADDEYKTRFEYETDCKVEATVKCFIANDDSTKTMTECSEGLYRRNDIEDCRGIKLWYEWKICNNEESQVKLARGKSKFVKGGNNLRQKPKGKLAAGKCSVASRVVPVNTCDFDGEELAISAVVKDKQQCRDYNFLKVFVADATPSASPTTIPSVSAIPSASPSVSQNPTVSMNPSSKPSKKPSASPTNEPSRKPSPAPSVSAAPSLKPSKSPSTGPSDEPSSSPSGQPSLSMVPSAAPSDNPTVSMLPSCVPSSEPTLSLQPSAEPSYIPSASAKPSNMPSNKPTPLKGVPDVVVVPETPIVRRNTKNIRGGSEFKRRNTKSGSSSNSSSSSSSKSSSKSGKSGKSVKNICQPN